MERGVLRRLLPLCSLANCPGKMKFAAFSPSPFMFFMDLIIEIINIERRKKREGEKHCMYMCVKIDNIYNDIDA